MLCSAGVIEGRLLDRLLIFYEVLIVVGFAM